MEPTQTEQITSTIPSWAQPYASQLLGGVFGGKDPTTGKFIPGLVGQGYQPYDKQRVAGFSPLQQQGMEGIAGMKTAPEMDVASNMAGLAGLKSGMAGTDYFSMATNPLAMGSFMSPYMNNVIEQQKRGAIQDYRRQLPGIGAAAARVGGRGGSREALLQSEANRNLQGQLQGIEASGLQNAFQNAQQSQQFGANLGLQGLQQQLAAAGALGGLGMQRYQQGMGITQAQLGAGAQGQALEQEMLNQRYQDFINQQQFPYKQAEFGMGLLRGIPATGQTGTLYQQSPNLFAQIAGGGAGLGSLFGSLGSGGGR
jgi:hypothetical protein